jgi:Tfp pilus assembly protein PilN
MTPPGTASGTPTGTTAGTPKGTAAGTRRGLTPAGWKRWLAVGSGVGIHIEGPRGSESARVAAVRLRPGGARLMGSFAIEDLPRHPAAEWGATITAFLRKLGLQNVAATVLLPRRDVILRVLAMPGVSAADLPAAVRFQMDGLHPYSDDDVISSWSRLPDTGFVVVAIARRDVIERYATLFQEAGVRIGGFSCSAAAVYSALRVFGRSPGREILAADTSSEGIEVYGESASRPVFSGFFPLPAAGHGPAPLAQAPALAHAQAVAEDTAEDTGVDLAPSLMLAAAELRIEAPAEPLTLGELLGSEPALAFAAALLSAGTRRGLRLNLLPVEHRRSGSKLVWIPAAALGLAVLALAGVLAAYPSIESRRYTQTLDAQIARVQPVASRATALDHEIDAVRRRTIALDDLRRRSRADMDALNELTRLLPPPAWLNLLELNPANVTIAGETDQAAGLLKTIDASPLFESSEFVVPPLRLLGSEGFRVRFRREGGRP